MTNITNVGSWPRSTHQRYVDEAMQKSGQQLPQIPCVPAGHVRLLLAVKLFDAAFNLMSSLGINVLIDKPNDISPEKRALSSGMLGFEAGTQDQVDLPAVAEHCHRVHAVATKTLSLSGIADLAIQNTIDGAELYGRPANVAAALAKQGWQPTADAEAVKSTT